MATLSELRTLALQRADKENSRFISTAEANNYINLAYGELYDLLVSQFADYYSTTVNFTLSGTNTYALPADFYKIRGLDYLISANNYVTVFPFNFNERNRFEVPVSRLVSLLQLLWQAESRKRCYPPPTSQLVAAFWKQ